MWCGLPRRQTAGLPRPDHGLGLGIRQFFVSTISSLDLVGVAMVVGIHLGPLGGGSSHQLAHTGMIGAEGGSIGYNVAHREMLRDWA